MKKLSQRFVVYFVFVLTNTLLFTAARAALFFMFRPEGQIPLNLLAKSFYIGLKFDLRIAFLISIPLGLILLFPLKPFLKKSACVFYALAGAALFVLYAADFGYYAYLSERLNAYIFDLASNTVTSLQMLWQSYPVVTFAIITLLVGLAYFFFVKKLLNYASANTEPKKHYWYVLPAFLIMGACIHGQLSQYPLRWSNAYFSNNAFTSALALNPLQNLYDTYKFSKKSQSYDADKTRKYYDVTADYFGVKNKDPQNLNFERVFDVPKDGPKNYNVVIILMESLAYDKTSFNAPEVDATPFLKEFAKNAKVFKRFFTPTAGTAKGLFASFTGLPDTSSVKTSSRNPLIVKQHLLAGDLEGYKKFYFIGGSANWGNVRGMLQYNIDDLKVFEEGVYEGVSRNDVWGLSDLDMFRYAAKELALTKEPFFAFLHTSGFHRPYTIPEDRGDFKVKTLDENMLKSYGFSGNADYNSLRFEDYSLGEFLRLAAKEPFFKNTIFFIYGDHGLTVSESKNSPKALVDLSLTTNNTPLVVYGPGVEAGVSEKVASQADVSATMMGLLKRPYRATALGRNIFDDNITHGAFVLNSSGTPLNIGYVEDEYYYIDWSNKKGLFKYTSDDAQKDYCQEQPQRCQRMHDLAHGLYESARYITFHHK